MDKSPLVGETSLLFSWPDYLVFALSLAIPLIIGVFFWVKEYFFTDTTAQTTENFLLGGRSMNFVAVSLSLLASLLNGVFVIGYPAEVHYYGSKVLYSGLGLLIAIVLIAHLFVTKYQAMLFTSAYEYLERRYNVVTRMVASATFCLSVIIFLAVVLYVPALAFNQVTNVSIYITIALTGVVCTIYTTIGGLKAVIWTDSIQMVILFIGLIAMAGLATAKLGGTASIFDVAHKNGRLDFNEFTFDPRARTSFWTQCFGTAIVYIGLFSSNQMMVQRYMSVSNPLKAQSAMYMTLAMFIPLMVLIIFIGLTVHARYHTCDPLIPRGPNMPGLITTADQIFPLFIMDLMGEYKGIPGLLMSSIFAAALSSVSSVINSLSAVMLEDFVGPALLHTKNKKLSDKSRKIIAIITVIFFGVLTIGLSFAADKFTSKLVQATNTIWGVIGGPLAGIFTMGFLFPFCNAWGAISGMLTGLIVGLWICVGNIAYADSIPTLPVGLCNNATASLPLVPPPHDYLDVYDVAYSWYGAIGHGTCLIVGIVVSLLYKVYEHYSRGRSSEAKLIDHSLIYSVADNCCCCCPLTCILCYRCGAEYLASDDVATRADKALLVFDV